jgi:adenosylhomocysteine nucleosidase
VSDLLILTATELETCALARHLELAARPGPPFSHHGRPGVRLASIGIGAGRLAERWPRLLEGLADPLVISAGVCGALDPGLRCGDLVLPRAVLHGDRRLDVDTAVHARAAARVPGAAGGALVAVDAVVAEPRSKAALHARTGAVAVDMESAAILLAARAAGHPALVVRGVSDRADQGLPRALLSVVSPDGRLSAGAALGLLARPRALPRALAVGRATRSALAAVARALAALAA